MTVKTSLTLLAVTALTWADSASAGAAARLDLGCRGNPGLIGRCYCVRGTMNLSADSGLILTRDDTGRAVVLWKAPNSRGRWPSNLTTTHLKAQRDTGFVSAWVHGDFEVCPVPTDRRDRPDLHFVCVEAATHLRGERPGDTWPGHGAKAAAAEKKRDDQAAAREMERRLGLTPP